MATVTPIRSGVMVPAELQPPKPPTFICPVCMAEEPVPPAEFLVACDTCGAHLHHECYWGRVASLEEWRAWLRWLNDDEKFEKSIEWSEPAMCPACREASAVGSSTPARATTRYITSSDRVARR